MVSRGRTIRNALHSNGHHSSAPANPQFLFMRQAPPAEFPAGLHENWVLECEAGGSPPPTIHWLRNGRPVTQKALELDEDEENEVSAEETNAISEAFTPVMGIGSTKSRLYLDCTGPQDEANYACVAETPYQRVSATSHVMVTADATSSLNSLCAKSKKSLGTPARINMWTGNMLETIGNDVVLFCRTLGSPSPRVTWLIEDDVIKSNSKYQVQENGDLLIRNIDWSDMGEYVCVAENNLGRDSAATFLYPVKREEE